MESLYNVRLLYGKDLRYNVFDRRNNRAIKICSV